MEIGDIISDAVKFPSSDWKKVLTLGVFMILSIIIIGIPFVLGYYLRVIKSTLAGYDELPEFDDWGGMFVDGLKVIVVDIVYFIIPFIVILVGVVISAATSSLASTAYMTNPWAYAGLLGGVGIIGIILAVIFNIIALMATANLALYDELGAAFKFSEIIDRISMISWGKYIGWFLVMIVIWVVFGFIGGLISAIPVIGFIIASLVVYSYLHILNGRSIALIFASSEDNQPPESYNNQERPAPTSTLKEPGEEPAPTSTLEDETIQ